MSIVLVKMANQGKESMVLDFQQQVYCCVLNGITPAQLNGIAPLTVFPLINAGHTRQLRLINYRIVVNGADVGGSTDIRISTTDATPVDLVTVVVAGLTNGSRISGTTSTNVTYGAKFANKLNQGAGINLRKTGATATGAFTIDILLEFDVA
jgi:hypothetical protein